MPTKGDVLSGRRRARLTFPFVPCLQGSTAADQGSDHQPLRAKRV